MKTIVIWDQCGQADISFFVVQGDKSHLNNLYIGGYITEEQEDEINQMIAYNDDGNPQVKMLMQFPTYELSYINNGRTVFDFDVKIITCGFIP